MAEIQAVTLEDIQRLARTLLDPAQMGICALGTQKTSRIRKEDVA